MPTTDYDLPSRADDLQGQLRAALEPGERVLWTGFPRQGIAFSSQDIFMIPFSLMWGGFAIFWEASVFSSGKAPLFVKLCGVPFVLIGLYIILGRFFADAAARARTIYSLTDRRIVILGGLWKKNTRSIELAGLSEINLTKGQNGRGSIVFGPPPTFGSGARGWPMSSRYQSPSFDGIPEARSVLTQIRDAQRKLRATP